MDSKKRSIGIAIIVILGLAALMYLSGLLGQLLANYSIWLESGGISGESSMPPVNWSLIKCLQQSFTPDGFKAMLIILATGGGIFLESKTCITLDELYEMQKEVEAVTVPDKINELTDFENPLNDAISLYESNMLEKPDIVFITENSKNVELFLDGTV